ncbi:hypothetical protein BGZ73_001995, partial [Actinomortierella ambigua]
MYLFVTDLGPCDFILGWDSLPRLGFGFYGAYTHQITPGDEFINDEEKPSIIPDERPPEELEPEFIEAKKKFMDALAPLLAENKQISPKSFCPHPLMKIKLRMKEGAVIQQPGRRFFAQTQKEEVDKTVQQWIDDGIVIPAPPN